MNRAHASGRPQMDAGATRAEQPLVAAGHKEVAAEVVLGRPVLKAEPVHPINGQKRALCRLAAGVALSQGIRDRQLGSCTPVPECTQVMATTRGYGPPAPPRDDECAAGRGLGPVRRRADRGSNVAQRPQPQRLVRGVEVVLRGQHLVARSEQSTVEEP